MRSLRWFALTVLVGAPGTGGAQDSAPEAERPFTVRTAALTGGAVCNCQVGGKEAPRDRELYMLAVGTRWRVAGEDAQRMQLDYVMEALPLIVSRRTADEHLHVWSCGSSKYCGDSRLPYPWRTTAVGLGVLPIGLSARIRLTSGVAVRGRLAGGALRLSQPVPLVQGSKFNFVAEGSVGTEVAVNPQLAVSAGLTQNHVSNGGTTAINLGMDSRMVEFGFVYRAPSR